MENKLKKSIAKAGKSLFNFLPVILGTLLLLSLVTAIIPKTFYTSLFQSNAIINSIIGSLVGSISAGNPITSYIIGGEMLKQNISLFVVTAFLVSWVTVGIVQFPAEASALGKKFAFFRNLSAFILSIIVAIITILILGVFK